MNTYSKVPIICSVIYTDGASQQSHCVCRPEEYENDDKTIMLHLLTTPGIFQLRYLGFNRAIRSIASVGAAGGPGTQHGYLHIYLGHIPSICACINSDCKTAKSSCVNGGETPVTQQNFQLAHRKASDRLKMKLSPDDFATILMY